MQDLQSLKNALAALDKARAFLAVAVAEQPLAVAHNDPQALDAAIARVSGEIGLVLAVLPDEVAYDALARSLVAHQIVSAIEAGEELSSQDAAQGLIDSWGKDDVADVEAGVFNAIVQIARD